MSGLQFGRRCRLSQSYVPLLCPPHRSPRPLAGAGPLLTLSVSEKFVAYNCSVHKVAQHYQRVTKELGIDSVSYQSRLWHFAKLLSIYLDEVQCCYHDESPTTVTLILCRFPCLHMKDWVVLRPLVAIVFLCLPFMLFLPN